MDAKFARRLIVNADDFGRSSSINTAIIHAHREGILTSASLMVNEPAFEEAITMAKQNPKLGVGLHLTLVCGKSGLPYEKIPGLIDREKNFANSPVAAGIGYFFTKELREQLEDEITEQFRKFVATGLPLDHVNGHLNIHLHPTIFSILMENAARWKIRRLRLTDDPFLLNTKVSKGRMLYRASHWFIYRWLSRRAQPPLLEKNIRHTERVFGLLQNAHVDETYILKLLENLP